MANWSKHGETWKEKSFAYQYRASRQAEHRKCPAFGQMLQRRSLLDSMSGSPSVFMLTNWIRRGFMPGEPWESLVSMMQVKMDRVDASLVFRLRGTARGLKILSQSKERPGFYVIQHWCLCLYSGVPFELSNSFAIWLQTR